jgi:hypothetical protein
LNKKYPKGEKENEEISGLVDSIIFIGSSGFRVGK